MKISKSHEFVVPASVYRLQLSALFPLSQAIKILPYLKALGVEGVYCSPYFQAYSTHGYDITDPNQFNPEIGTPEEFKAFYKALKKYGFLHIIDVVPNHMGIKGGKNLWWQDVLENGPYSNFATFFDINWSPEKKELHDKVLLPILGSPYGTALRNGEISLEYRGDQFVFQYADYPLPVAPHAYALILGSDLEILKTSFKKNDPDLKAYVDLIEHYQNFPIASQEREIQHAKGLSKLTTLLKRSRKLKAHVNHVVARFNQPPYELLDRLLEGQFYRLAYWRVAGHEINYRRFFNLAELVSIKIEEETVLNAHHDLLFHLIEKGNVQGIRIDHPDGLYDPVQYFQRLRQRFKLFTVAEKILERKEKLHSDWDVEGTVGYEYLNILNGVFVAKQNEEAMTSAYREFIGIIPDFDECLYHAKKYFATVEMASDVESLALKLDQLSESNPEYRDFTRPDLTVALTEVISCFPVYRSYLGPEVGPSARDAHYIKIAIDKAKSKAGYLDISLFDFLEKLLLTELKPYHEDEKESYRSFILRFQQLTAPIMAKGLEDTICYFYNRLLSLNEVGGDPRHFGNSVEEFHSYNQEKKEEWPYGFLATSTHDTKRSEDVRARLNVLSEITDKWLHEVRKWALVNQKHKKGGPTDNTEYFIYQTLLGLWPKHPIKKSTYPAVCERIWQIILKSLREAKQETSWRSPNEPYETAVRNFFFEILSHKKTNRFLPLFKAFHALIDRYGAWNSLSQVILKCGSPGVVDIYQGNERLTYRCVDPDNRAPIHFEAYQKELCSLYNASATDLFTHHELNKLKLLLHTQALHYRTEHKELFLDGDYIPLAVKGTRQENVIAFLRQSEDDWAIVIAARFYTKLADADWDVPLGQHVWGNTKVILPSNWGHPILTDLFTGNKVLAKRRALHLAEVFEHLPVCILHS